jgi:murein DD-endopeptidase MepM/ murein hydrolase activator NlpD
MTFRLEWPTDYAEVTQPFGANPAYYWTNFKLPGHEGIDIKAPLGSNIYACADGIVYFVGWGTAYGIHVRIDHENGYKTLYAHFQRSLVKTGQRVAAKQVIGKADSTGNSTGSHLHLTLKENGATASGKTRYPSDIIDPTPYLNQSDSTHKMARVTAANGLRFRDYPSLAGKVITVLPHGTVLELLKQEGDWWMLQIGTATGWCSAAFLEVV